MHATYPELDNWYYLYYFITLKLDNMYHFVIARFILFIKNYN